MLKGSREAILRRVQPISVHGQISWDIYFADAEPGDRIRLDYTLGAVIGIHKVATPA
jgi:hypothetical protein